MSQLHLGFAKPLPRPTAGEIEGVVERLQLQLRQDEQKAAVAGAGAGRIQAEKSCVPLLFGTGFAPGSFGNSG
jgi:hypothetical protein